MTGAFSLLVAAPPALADDLVSVMSAVDGSVESFASLSAALAAAAAGDKVTLLGNITEPAVAFDKPIGFDLGGFTWNVTSGETNAVLVTAGGVSVSNGTLRTESMAIITIDGTDASLSVGNGYFSQVSDESGDSVCIRILRGSLSISTGATLQNWISAEGPDASLSMTDGLVEDGPIYIARGASGSFSGGTVSTAIISESAGTRIDISGSAHIHGLGVQEGACATISGGLFGKRVGHMELYGGIFVDDEPGTSLVVTGGHFAENPSPYVDFYTHMILGNEETGYDVVERLIIGANLLPNDPPAIVVSNNVFLVRFRALTTGATYQLVATDDPSATSEQWLGIAASNNAVAVGLPASSTAAAASDSGELLELRAPLNPAESVRFFRIRARY